MFKQLNKNKSGFTIIEVLIVLAIAGLIMVVVFLAVPALQRNSRNSQRDADAQRILGAVNDCVANNNGQAGNCDGTSSGDQFDNYITVGENQQLTDSQAGNANINANAVDQFDIIFKANCNAAGTVVETNANTPDRAFVVTYNVETNSNPQLQCIGG